MTHDEWLAYVKEHTVVDIGQLEPCTKRALDREVEAGRLIKWREPWLGCLGAARSHWGRPLRKLTVQLVLTLATLPTIPTAH